MPDTQNRGPAKPLLRSENLVRTLRTFEIGLALAIVLIVAGLVTVTLRQVHRGERNQELLRLNEHQDTELVLSHLWLEEALGGDTTVDVSRDVLGTARAGQLFCYSTLGTGGAAAGDVQAVTVEPLRGRIARMCEHVELLRELTNLRLNTSDAAGGTSLDERYDRVFTEYLAASALLDEEIGRLVNNDRSRMERLFAVALGLLPLLAGLMVGVTVLSRRAIYAGQRELARLAAVVASTDDAVITKSLDGVVLSWNPGAERMLGYTAEETVGKPVFDLIPPEWRHVERDVLERIGRGENIRSYEAVREAKDGRRITISLSVAPILDDEGRPIAAASISRDITGEKETAAALAASRAELDALIRSMTDVILVLDAEGRYVSIPATAAPLLYRPPQELIGRRMHELLSPEAADLFLGTVRRALESRQTVHLEYGLPIGERHVWFAAVVSPMTDDQVVWVARDVTERRVVEEELRRREQQLAESQQLARVGSWTWNLADGRLTWSDQLYEMTGYAKQSFQPTFARFLERVHPEDQARVEEVIGRAVEDRAVLDFEYRTVRPDGGVVCIHSRGEPAFDSSGELVHYRGMVQDITERKRAEEELIAAREAAEAASRAKSDFLSGMSHELRTPLNSVIGFGNILRKNKGGNLREQDLNYLDRILANGKHLLGLINDILDLSKIEAGKMELDVSPVALDALIEITLDELQGSLAGKPVRLLLEVPDDLASIDTDAGRMKQVLINLIGNAIKFTERGSVKVVVRSDERTAKPTRIDVVDTGVGIAAERLGSIFDPFVQAEQGTSRKYGGTGLGLAISRSLVELLGYELEVTSTEGAGSTFSIVLASGTEPGPVSAATRPVGAAAATPTRTPAEDFTGKLVLVIDDETDSRVLLTEQIEEFGCRVVAASSGEQGLRIARELRPDLITVDLLMPDLDGWETLRLLKREPALADTPMVVVSVVAGDPRPRVLGPVDVFEKPVEPDTLLAMLRRHLGGEVRRVLVVDDEFDSRLLLQNYLQAADLDVALADSGERALQMLTSYRPDLIVLDLVMPGMGGLGFLRTIREQPANRDIPVVIVTAMDLSHEESGAVGHNVIALFRKNGELDEEIHGLVQELWNPSTPRAADA